MVTCWERANFLALLCVMFSCVFVTFPCGVLGQVWYLTVLIPDLCLLPFFIIRNIKHFFRNLRVFSVMLHMSLSPAEMTMMINVH